MTPTDQFAHLDNNSLTTTSLKTTIKEFDRLTPKISVTRSLSVH